MEKTLILLRHAKSDWDADYSGDHERPLSKRGRKAAKAIGEFLSDTRHVPDEILCSTAARTRETISLVRENANWNDVEVTFTEDLYLAAPENVLSMVRGLPVSSECVMVVGHQPFTGILASGLLGGRSIEVPTGCLIVIELAIDSWSQISRMSGKLVEHILPRSLV